ncbi:hypothetical protein RP20_CCG027203, partial [Aedes albopictus]
ASSGQYAHYVFNSIDLDRNGSLSFEKMDRNCDGKITLDEFIECCTTDESIRRSIAVFDTIF